MLNYDYFYDWVERKLGVNLYGYKDAQMQRRLASIMTKSGAKDFQEYVKMLEIDKVLRQQLHNHITINVTEFMRNKDKFKEFEKVLITDIAPHHNRVKIWSAACSNGSEPYTVGILSDMNKILNKVDILATDIDDNMLSMAKIGGYEERDIKALSPDIIKKYFTEKDNKFYISEEIKRAVTFKKHDLMKDRYERNNHVIVCRNVTIYFKNEVRDEIYQKFSDSLAPGGVLFIGATESVYNPSSFGLKKINNSIYQKC